jgi:hypothetical protein
MLAGMQWMWDHHRSDVDVLGIGGDWPIVTITSPKNDSTFTVGAQIQIVAQAWDNDGLVDSVEFFANDTLKIVQQTTAPDSVYSVTWSNVSAGNYTLTAVATDNQRHKRTSNRVQIKVGTPAMTRLEAEAAVREGDVVNLRIVSGDPTASRSTYLDIHTQNGRISWTLGSVPAAGNYEIAFAYRLAYDTPKDQYINVNGTRVAELRFDGAMNVWLEKKLAVSLIQGINTIQMELYWGWMHLDYLAVPTSIVSSVAEPFAEVPRSFSLEQNYPNPFNPTTAISYRLPGKSLVVLKVFDVLGREAATLVNEERPPGTHTVEWDASAFASGVYFCRLEARNAGQRYVRTIKMVLLR